MRRSTLEGRTRLSTRARMVGAGILTAAVFGCDDAPNAPNAPNAAPASNVVAGNASKAAASAERSLPETPERVRQHARGAELARAVARALSQPSLRNDVRKSMRDAQQREHKLEVRAYLASADGGR